jgi:hypothetical protein
VTSPSKYRNSPKEAPDKLTLPWDCDRRVEGIFVDPYAPEFFFEAVESVVRTFSPTLEARLVWSQMKAAPVF